MLTVETLNELYQKGYRIDTLNEVYGFDLPFSGDKTKDSVFLIRNSRKFVNILTFLDVPVNKVLVKNYTDESMYVCNTYDLF